MRRHVQTSEIRHVGADRWWKLTGSAIAHMTDTDLAGAKVRSKPATGAFFPSVGSLPSGLPVTGSASWASIRCSIRGESSSPCFSEPGSRQGQRDRGLRTARAACLPRRSSAPLPPIFSGLPIVSTGSVHPTGLTARRPGLSPIRGGDGDVLVRAGRASHQPRPAVRTGKVPEVHQKVVRGWGRSLGL